MALYCVAGVLLAAALSLPELAFAAWLAIAVYTVALARTRSSLVAGIAVVGAHGLTCMIAFPWMWDGNFRVFDYSLAGMIALRFGEAMILAVPYGLGLGLGHALAHRWLAPRVWVPLAWAGGELLSYATSNACVDDWLNTQWTVQPVLRALAVVGWWPLMLACLFAAASVGEAFATWRWRLAIPSLAIVVAIGLAPPIADGKAERLEGITAMHTTSTLALPHVLPDGTDLLIWPETAIELRPLLGEGPGNGARLPPLLPGTHADHLIGLQTSLPGLRQNQVVAVRADGRVLASRAKQAFLPVAERRFLGFGQTPYHPGDQPALLEVAGRAVVPLICGEGLSRGLLADGVAAGGQLWTIHAGDQWLASERALQQFLAIQVVRSVEFGLPSIRASFRGQATFVAADGRVLATSVHDRNGVLTWDRQRGGQNFDFRGRMIDDGPMAVDPPADVAVLYSEAAPHLRARCPEGRCAYYPLEDFVCSGERASAVIVAGHGQPPDYLSRPVAEVAAAIRCFEPDVVVIDTCFGASSELLAGLGDLDAEIVAAATLVASSGFVYDFDFFAATDPKVRATAVHTLPASRLLRWHNDPTQLAELLARVEAMDASELADHLARRQPTAVRVELADGGPVLVPIAWERLGSQRSRTMRRPRMRPAPR